jgi:fructokinase
LKTLIDIICVGEVIIDFIGHELSSIEKTENFQRFLGGSPTNVAVNATRLGLNVALVATCGNDGLGDFILESLESNKVNTTYFRKSSVQPSSVIFVSKSKETPEFIPFRHADCEILEEQLPDELLANAKIFHTTCFALSKEPARTSILNSAKRAKELGLQLSIDINFSEKIWENRKEAFAVLIEYLALDPLVKLSDDDCFRLFEETKSDAFVFDYFHNLGVTTVCLTKGKDGVKLSDKKQGLFFQEALQLEEIKDVTGAGDAFWAGFLFAILKNKSFEECITIAQKLARIKLQNIGSLPGNRDIVSELMWV